MTDRTWLDGLKVGDEVAYKSDNIFDNTYCFHRIKSISPKRNSIALDNGMSFDANGDGKGAIIEGKYLIEPDLARAWMKTDLDAKLLQKLRGELTAKVKNLNLEQTQEVLKFLDTLLVVLERK